MIDSGGWVDHPVYGRVYQPGLSKAKTDVHADRDAWYGEEYDVLSGMLDRVAYASARETLLALLDAGPGPYTGWAVRAMLRTIDRQQHGTADESGDES